MLAVLLAFGAQASSSFSPEDQKVIDNAQVKVAEYCDRAAASPKVDYEKEKAVLEGGLPIFKVLTESPPGKAMSQAMDTLSQPNFVANHSWPVVLGALVLVAYSVCCWSACCRCCRRCRRERKASFRMKGVFVALVLLVFAGFIAIASLAFTGFQRVDDGIATTGCASATLLKDLLAGDPDNNFAGLLPVVQTFESLVAKLEPGSVFLTGLQSTLNRTKDIENSVAVVGGMVKLLQDMMAVPENVRPKSPAGLDLMHKCTLCSELAPILDPVAEGLEKGTGSVLAKARAEVKKQLDGPRLGALRQDLQTTIDPMVEFKKTFTESVGFFVNPGGMDEYAPYFQGNGSALFGLVMYASVVLFLVLLCACSSLGCWVCMEQRPESRPGSNPYIKNGRTCAACSWCNATIYAIVMLIFGGLLLILSVPISGACLVMLDFDKELGQNVMATLEIGGSNDSTSMFLNIADKCLSAKSASKYSNVSLNLLDMVTVENSTGGKVTVREEVITKAIDPVKAQFEAVTATLVKSPAALSNSSDVLKLRTLLRTAPISAMILPDIEEIRSSNQYKALGDDPRTQVGSFTSMSCENFTTGTELGNSQVLPGMKFSFDLLATLGTADPTSSCMNHTQRLLPLSCSGYAPCIAGNKFLTERKNVLAASARFRCDLFQHPSGVGVCDPKAMYKSNGVWHNTCLDDQGRMQIQPRTCSLAEFDKYVEEFDVRLANAFLMLDETVQSSLSGIDSDLRTLVESHVLAPIYNVVNNFECGFMRSFYTGLLDGVCFQGLGGYRAISSSYAAGALLSLVLGLVMYAAWRVMKDNYDTWQEKKAHATP
eukprot:TRINITY_DN5867_c0_g1_i1.p1 TRINITY_DN5867_c0_g1~~TRINITY_DN5867_c0_g1_i1.p1  ORF type:complete len:852 (-),score=134.45 TRINITY_DN5867_c0_g1_i1:118-2595(-)